MPHCGRRQRAEDLPVGTARQESTASLRPRPPPQAAAGLDALPPRVSASSASTRWHLRRQPSQRQRSRVRAAPRPRSPIREPPDVRSPGQRPEQVADGRSAAQQGLRYRLGHVPRSRQQSPRHCTFPEPRHSGGATPGLQPTHLPLGARLDLKPSSVKGQLGLQQWAGQPAGPECAPGKYWPALLAAGLRVTGADQSAGILAQARRKHPGVPARVLGLQDLAGAEDLRGQFDGLLRVDALENIAPEDWPGAVAGLAATLKPRTPAYVTVEVHDGPLPGPGDPRQVADEDFEGGALGGYHYYPARDQARDWLVTAGFRQN